MSGIVFPEALSGFANAEIDWDGAVFKVALVRGYSYNAAHKFVSDVTGTGAVLHATSAALASKTTVAGVCDAADVVFSSVAANATGHGLLVFQSSAVGGGADVADGEKRVVAWYGDGTNMPFMPNGGDFTVQWPNDADKMFRI